MWGVGGNMRTLIPYLVLVLFIINLSVAAFEDDGDELSTSQASPTGKTIPPSQPVLDESTSLVFANDETDNHEAVSDSDTSTILPSSQDSTVAPDVVESEETDLTPSLTPTQESVVEELRDIWEYSLSLNDTTDKELKTTLSNVVQLAYARVQIEPDDTLDRLKYLLEKLRQRIGVSTTSTTMHTDANQITTTDRPPPSTTVRSIPRSSEGRDQTHPQQSLITRRKRSWSLGTGIGEVEPLPSSEENSIFSNYNKPINPPTDNKIKSSYYEYHNLPTNTPPSDKTVQKILVVQDQVTIPVVSNQKTTGVPSGIGTTEETLTVTYPPTMFYPSLQASFSQYSTKIPGSVDHQEPDGQDIKFQKPLLQGTNFQKQNSHSLNSQKQNLKDPNITTPGPGESNYQKTNPGSVKIPKPTPARPILQENAIYNNNSPNSVSVEQIASEIVKLLYPPQNDTPGVQETPTTTTSPGPPSKPIFTFPQDKYLFQEKLALLGPNFGVRNPFVGTTTKTGLYPTYLQIHPLPSLTSEGNEAPTTLPPVLLNLIANLKNQSGFIKEYFSNVSSEAGDEPEGAIDKIGEVTTVRNDGAPDGGNNIAILTTSSNSVAQIMGELTQGNILQGTTGAVLNGTRDGILQFVATLSTLSFTTKMVIVFALSISVLSIVLGVYSLGPPIIAVGILGIMIPICILVLLQDSSRGNSSSNGKNPKGKVSLNDQMSFIIDLIDKAVDRYGKYEGS